MRFSMNEVHHNRKSPSGCGTKNMTLPDTGSARTWKLLRALRKVGKAKIICNCSTFPGHVLHPFILVDTIKSLLETLAKD